MNSPTEVLPDWLTGGDAPDQSSLLPFLESLAPEGERLLLGRKTDTGYVPTETLPPGAALYANTGSFIKSRTDADGKLHAKAEAIEHCLVLVCDDVGTKAKAPPVPPTWVIETSPGNYQWGYAYSTRPTKGEHSAAVKAIAAAGYSDPGASGPVRWFRIPGSVNKTKGGFVSRLVSFHPERRYTLAQLCDLMGVTAEEQQLPAGEQLHGQDTARANAALLAIPNDMERDLWFKLLASAKEAGCSYEVAERWSNSFDYGDPASNKEAAKVFPAQWKSIAEGKPGGLRGGLLFKMAAAAGWKDPRHEVDVSAIGFAPVPSQPPAEWGDPKPIPKLLLPVLPFDYDLLPPPLAAWVRDTAERKCWAPDFLAVGLIDFAATLVGRKVVAKPLGEGDDWRIVPNQWALLVGVPSAAKSPAIETVMEFVAPMIASASQQFETQTKVYESEREFHEAEVKALEAKRQALLKGDKNNPPDREAAREVHDDINRLKEAFNLRAPREKRYITTDTTAEALFKTASENPQGFCLVADEMQRLLKQMESENFASLRGLALSAWSGNQKHILDRVTGNRANVSAHVCLSFIGGIQPGILHTLFGNSRDGGEGDDGLPQRFGLTVWPDGVEARPESARPGDSELERAVQGILNRLDSIIAFSEGDPTRQHIMPFDSVASADFNRWHCKMRNDIQNGIVDPSISTFVNKYPKVLGGLALLFALCDGERDTVPMSAWQRALKWEPYLKSHLERAIGYATTRTDAHAQNIVGKLKNGKVGTKDEATGMVYTSARELQRKCLPGCDTAVRARELLDWLEELGYVRSGHVKGVKEAFFVNPKLFSGC